MKPKYQRQYTRATSWPNRAPVRDSSHICTHLGLDPFSYRIRRESNRDFLTYDHSIPGRVMGCAGAPAITECGPDGLVTGLLPRIWCVYVSAEPGVLATMHERIVTFPCIITRFFSGTPSSLHRKPAWYCFRVSRVALAGHWGQKIVSCVTGRSIFVSRRNWANTHLQAYKKEATPPTGLQKLCPSTHQSL